MSVFTNQIPPGSPVIVALIEMDGCPACQEYHPVFERVAKSFADRGLPIVRIDAQTEDPASVAFMNKHGVQSTPTVIAATLHRGPVARIEGAATEIETRHLFLTAWAHNRPRVL